MPRTTVITGAGSGIGKRTAELLRERGETVIGVDLRGAEVDADLSTPAGRVAGAEAAIAAANGSVDAVVASAGIAHQDPRTVSVNYFGMTEFLEAMRPTLAASKAPRAALVASMSTLQPNVPQLVDAMLANNESTALQIAGAVVDAQPEGGTVYASSKRAIARWVRREAASAAWAGAGIPLNAVGPGVVLTPMTEQLVATEEGRQFLGAAVPMPLHGFQDADSVARLLIWLTSVENSHCCGQVIFTDGGSDVVLRGDDAFSWADERVLDYFTRLMSGGE